MKSAIFCLAVSLPGLTGAWATNYYVDAASGLDSYDGLAPGSAWKTLTKINSIALNPGDSVLLNRGQTWTGPDEKLIVTASGLSGQPIVFGAYGTGPAPIIDGRGVVAGSTIPANWHAYSTDVWRIAYDTVTFVAPLRLWLSEVEYKEAASVDSIGSVSRWRFDGPNTWLYVYAPSNPATTYSSVTKATGLGAAAVIGASDVTIRDLDLRGGYVALEIDGTDHFTIEDSSVGWGAAMGIVANWKYWPPTKATADYGIIRRCTIDSGHRLTYTFNHAYPEDGIHLGDGANHWEVHDNGVKDWGHTGIYVEQQTSGLTASYNKVYSNRISAPSEGWSRGFAVMGLEGGAQHNEFYFNTVSSTTCGNELLGDHNSFHYNIVAAVKNSPYWPNDGTANAFNIGVWPPFVSHHNKLANNVIFACEEAGIGVKATYAPGDIHYVDGLSIHDTEIKNNLVFDCGKDSRDSLPGIGLSVANQTNVYGNIFEHNLIYTAGAANVVSYRGTLMSVSGFNASSGTLGDAMEDNYQVDPRLIDPANDDFRLQAGSPMIDGGTAAGLSTDIAGTPVPQGPRPDIGAYEYVPAPQEVIYATAAPALAFIRPFGTVALDIPAGAQAADYYVVFRGSPVLFPGEVDPRKILAADDQIAPGLGRVSDSLVELNAYDLSGLSVASSFAKTMALSMSYPDADGDGLVDRVVPPVNAKSLKLYTLDEINSLWQELPGSAVNDTLHLVRAPVGHFSVFSLMGAASTSPPSRTRAWPNPFNPSRTPFMTFSPVPMSAKVTIYTLLGEKVRTVCDNASAGVCRWDGKNAGGNAVASGVYFVLIKGDGIKQTLKIAVQR